MLHRHLTLAGAAGMQTGLRSTTVLTAVFALLVLASTPAHAFRCGSKIVAKDMHEAQVRRACGAPTTVRHIGRTLRNINIPIGRNYGGGWRGESFPGYGYSQEVIVTEYVYNFGPRKLMRRLVFEGGVLVTIESLGYGYHEK
jgi:hypothetical protein